MSLIWSTNVRINTEILKIELLILYFFIVVLLNFDVDRCPSAICFVPKGFEETLSLKEQPFQFTSLWKNELEGLLK